MGDVGGPHDSRGEAKLSNIPSDAGRYGGGTYTAQSLEPTIEAYENIFGPSARDIKSDLQRFKRHGRWHLPDVLKGPNMYLTDRVDGLITDAASSPFTSRILPYAYNTNVDGKIKWNVYSFDEGLAGRVPYESAARVLTQTKRSHAGYTVRSGLAIALEHNFMMSEKGKENFKNQLQQLVGCIQMTNDLDVHMALVLAESHAKIVRENFLSDDKSPTQICRDFVELFGYVQKHANAMDVLIEEAKILLKSWGGPMPDFLLLNSKLTFQLTMTPEVTSYVTQGPEGPKRLKRGPDIHSYRGITIIPTRSFSLETGTIPRDILRRRVRVAEYYRISPHPDNHRRVFQFYNEERDTWFNMSFVDLLRASLCKSDGRGNDSGLPHFPADSNRNAIEAVIAQIDMYQQRKRDDMFGGGGGPMVFDGMLSPRGGPGWEDTDGARREGRTWVHQGVIQRPRPANVTARMSTQLSTLSYEDHRPENNSGHIQEGMTQFFCQLLSGEIRPEFDINYTILYKNWVYVPGCVDFYPTESTAARTAADTAINRLTSVNALQYSTRASNDGRNYFMNYAVNSVAEYPRSIKTILQNGISDDMENPYKEKIKGFDKKKNIRFLTSLAVRNHMRYGVPNKVIRDENATTYAEALDLTETISEYSPRQILRNVGALYSPNHFGQSRKLPGDMGTFIGYNIIITDDMIDSLTRSKTPDTDSWFIGTIIYRMLKLVDNAQEDLKLITKYLQQTVNAFTALDLANKKRVDLTSCFLNAKINDGTTAKTFLDMMDDNARDHNYSLSKYGVCWMWPNSDGVDDDIFLDNSSTIGDLFRKEELPDDLMITPALLSKLSDLPYSDEPFLTQVKLPHSNPVSTQDAVNFLHTLVWRIFGDQSLPLPQLSGEKIWPPIDHYLDAKLPYNQPNFGGNLISSSSRSSTPPMGPMVPRLGIAGVGNVEIVVVRPNIEHYMFGIILGMGGEGLGRTWWGQTELSCYDDSMHGLWGMSYKYNSRAIVTNTKALVRLWDVAYDCYVGGKNDSFVIWDSENVDDLTSQASLCEYTMQVSRHYRGPSMLVMAFDHGQAKASGQYANKFKSNWPSPIVFHDDLRAVGTAGALPTDFDNIHVVDTEEFRVLNSDIYRNAYNAYYKRMPNFTHLHRIRKNAGQATTEGEVSSDSLAFQGTMKILNEDGRVVEEITGSGHHGVDFIGVSSLRNGRGYKVSSQPEPRRMV